MAIIGTSGQQQEDCASTSGVSRTSDENSVRLYVFPEESNSGLHSHSICLCGHNLGNLLKSLIFLLYQRGNIQCISYAKESFVGLERLVVLSDLENRVETSSSHC